MKALQIEETFGGTSWLKPLHRAMFLLCLFSFWACNDATCTGADCGCDGSGDCILSCEVDDCDLTCAQQGGTCGAICGDDCKYQCHDTNHCSSYSGEGSQIECSNVSSCAGQCGSDCEYLAYEVSTALITVGPNSSVECKNLSRCEVECEGSCTVSCSQVSTCSVRCEDENHLLKGVSSTETVKCD